jgi:two-component system, cell cycle response regulator DivK
MAGERVLIVDDNDLDRKLLRDVLTFHGFETAEATSAEETLTQTTAFQPHVILMDIGLGDDDGVVVLADLRRTPEGAAAHVIAVTAHAMAEDRDRILTAGFDSYLSKPIDIMALSQHVREHCSVSTPEEQSETTAPDPCR